MTRNQASGGDRVRVARSHARRQSAAETRAVPSAWPSAARPGRIEVSAMRLPALSGDPGPRCHPLLERNAVALAVAALRQRGLPERDRLEVRLGRVGVVGVTGALL